MMVGVDVILKQVARGGALRVLAVTCYGGGWKVVVDNMPFWARSGAGLAMGK